MPERPDEFEEAWARIVEDLTSDAGPDGLGGLTAADGKDGADGIEDPAASTRADGSTGGPSPAGPGTAGVDPGLAALFEPLRRRPPQPEPAAAPAEDDPGAFVERWGDEGHFEPPIPPELPEGTPVKRLAWAGLLGGPAAFTLIALSGWEAPRVVSIAAGLATLAGFVTLVWLLPDAREDSGWDDGARL
ncbi:MAG TPA: hypothetical protein VF143_00505 [Candidatus Nanopelagicales bacterium]